MSYLFYYFEFLKPEVIPLLFPYFPLYHQMYVHVSFISILAVQKIFISNHTKYSDTIFLECGSFFSVFNYEHEKIFICYFSNQKYILWNNNLNFSLTLRWILLFYDEEYIKIFWKMPATEILQSYTICCVFMGHRKKAH